MGEVFAALGLAQNFAALRALATEGIQRGHMELHSRNVAIQAGATGDMVDKIARIMVSEKNVRSDRAKELLDEMMLQKKENPAINIAELMPLLPFCYNCMTRHVRMHVSLPRQL